MKNEAETEVKFFRSPGDLRRWFDKHHARAKELWVGYYKKATGKPSITWPESVDEALAVGWIDGIRRTIDDISYKIRFTPRRPGSTWSAVNIRRVQALIAESRMTDAGMKAFEVRRENRSGIYAYEQRPIELVEPYRGIFKKNKTAWEFFQKQPPSDRKTAVWWVISAKREETRLKRLEKLIEDSANNRPLRERSGKTGSK